MAEPPGLLVLTDVRSDAEMVAKLLSTEFDRVHVSTHADHFAADFERLRPKVLVLAFKSLGESERCHLGLYRRSAQIHTLAHRTVLLCAKADVRRAYELCRRDLFDDYAQFWPLAHDASRLPMAVHLALEALAHRDAAVPVARLAAQARRIAELESQLDAQLADGAARVQHASRTLHDARSEVGAALDRFTRRMIDGDLGDALVVHDATEVRREMGRLNDEALDGALGRAILAEAPVRDWLGTVRGGLAPQLEAARAMAEMAGRLRPAVLAVDDDAFVRALLGEVLGDGRYDVVMAQTGTEALASLRRRRPDLILMDVRLPDMNGVEMTRRLKAAPEHADIPIVMITGQSERQVIVDSLAAGAADFVVKPFERETLLRKIARLLGD